VFPFNDSTSTSFDQPSGAAQRATGVCFEYFFIASYLYF